MRLCLRPSVPHVEPSTPPCPELPSHPELPSPEGAGAAALTRSHRRSRGRGETEPKPNQTISTQLETTSVKDTRDTERSELSLQDFTCSGCTLTAGQRGNACASLCARACVCVYLYSIYERKKPIKGRVRALKLSLLLYVLRSLFSNNQYQFTS